MTPKKKEVIETSAAVPQGEPGRPVCGHVNKQFYGYAGVLEDLACTLAEGHPGDHQAPYERKVGEKITDEKGRVTKVTYSAVDAVCYWNDAAGVPAREVLVGTVTPLNLLQKDILMSVLSKRPELGMEEAMRIAKESREWLATVESS